MLRKDYDTLDGTKLGLVDLNDHQDPLSEVITRTVDLHTESWYIKKLRKLQS